MVELIIYLIALHLILDFPLQGEWLSKTKNPAVDLLVVKTPHETIRGESIWLNSLLSHAFIQAAGVFYVTQSLVLFLIEFILHTVIDYCKCKGYFGYNADQGLHIACKLTYVALIYFGVVQ